MAVGCADTMWDNNILLDVVVGSDVVVHMSCSSLHVCATYIVVVVVVVVAVAAAVAELELCSHYVQAVYQAQLRAKR